MKRHVLTVVLLFLLTCLCACQGIDDSSSTYIYDVEYNGTVYTVDYQTMTIAAGGERYHFQVSGGSARSRFEVTYPDGSTYWWEEDGMGGAGGWSDDYDPARYVPGDTLWKVLEQSAPSRRNTGGNPLLGLLLLAVGIFHAAAPRAAWFLARGWYYKDAQPSDLALSLNRVFGVIFGLAGVGCLFFG